MMGFLFYIIFRMLSLLEKDSKLTRSLYCACMCVRVYCLLTSFEAADQFSLTLYGCFVTGIYPKTNLFNFLTVTNNYNGA